RSFKTLRNLVPNGTLPSRHICCPTEGQRGGQDVMFDLFTGKAQHVPSTPAIPILVSSTVQGTALATIAVMSFVVASRELPPVPGMFGFVAEMPAVAPPPPPPPPVQTARAAQPTPPPANAFAAPIEAP